MTIEPPRIRVMYSFSFDGKTGTLLRWTRQRGKISHTRVWQDAFPPSGDGEKLLRSAVISAQSENALLCAALPVAETICRPLKTPFASMRKAKQVFPSLLDIQLPFELSDCCFTFLGTKEKAGQVHTLGLAVRNTTLDGFLAGLAPYGLNPHLLLHEGMMIWSQSLRESGPGPDKRLRVAVWAGMQRTVVVCGCGDRLESTSSLNIRYETLLEDETQRTLWIRRLMLSVKANREWADNAIDWWWCGPCAEDTETRSLLEKELDKLLNINFSRHADSDVFIEKAMATACFDRCIDANLRNGEKTHPDLMQRAQKHRTATFTGLLATGILLCLLNAAWMIRVSALQHFANRLITEESRELTGGGYIPRGQELHAVEQILNEKSGYLQHFRDVHERKAFHLIQRIIRAAAEQEIQIDLLDVSDSRVKIEGTAAVWSAALNMQSILDDLGLETRLTREEKSRKDAGSRFLLRGVIDEPEN